MREKEQGDKPRLPVEEFLEIYNWVNTYLPDQLGEAFDRFVSEEAVTMFPDDRAELYAALAGSHDRHMRLMAATGAGNLARVDPDSASALLTRLRADEDSGVARQATETAVRLLRYSS